MIGQAVEMDAVHGSPSFPGAGFPTSPMDSHDRESDAQGFMNLQPPQRKDDHMSMGSVYSADE